VHWSCPSGTAESVAASLVRVLFIHTKIINWQLDSYYWYKFLPSSLPLVWILLKTMNFFKWAGKSMATTCIFIHSCLKHCRHGQLQQLKKDKMTHYRPKSGDMITNQYLRVLFFFLNEYCDTNNIYKMKLLSFK
jgi:hypothetical protein